MTTDEWLWMALIILNAVCVGATITSMVRDGARRRDHVMLAVGAAIITVGLLKVAGAA